MTLTVTKPAGRKVLYFCPATMIGNVVREIRRWSPHRSVVVLGGQPKAVRDFVLGTMREHPEYVVVINYEAWRKDTSLLDSIIDLEFDTCIIDEAHNIKDMKSRAFRGINRILRESNIPFVIPMTGTPILNKPEEFFTLLTLVDPTHFWSLKHFLYDYCQQDLYTGKWKFKPGGVERLFKRFPHLFLRRTKEQAGIMLPPKTITVHEIEVDYDSYPNQARAREEMRKWGSIVLDPDAGSAIVANAAIAVYTRLRQIETWPAGIELKDAEGDVLLKLDIHESQKLDYIIKYQNSDVNDWTGLLPDMVYRKETGEGERVVIFSQFKQPLIELERRCKAAGLRAVRMDGDTPDSVRNEIAIDFDNRYTPDPANAKWDVVLCHYRVGGVGLNLTAATQMIIVDEEWNPGKRDQAYDRIHRMGQDKPVTIHVLRDKEKGEGMGQDGLPKPKGIDVWLADLIESKEQLVDGFHDVADNMAAQAYDALKSGLI